MTTTQLAPDVAPTVVAPVPPLTGMQEDAFLLLAASTEKVQKIKRTGSSQPGASRAWSLGGNVD